MAEIVSKKSEQGKKSKMNLTILDNFNNLKNGNDSIRLNTGVILLNHLRQHNTNQDDDKELNYALIRLVRSLGSSLIHAKKGSYSTLTVFLMMHPETPIVKLLSIMNTQLHPTGSNSKSENADIYMGRMLLCGALIRSEVLIQNTVNIQQQVVETLLESGRQRCYLSFISVMFLSEFINQIDIESMKETIWPIIEKEFNKPWSEQTLDSFYLLLVVRDKYPSLVNHKFLKRYLGVKDIITTESMDNIIKLLMGLPRIVSNHHPVFKLFCKKLVTSTELVACFWRSIDQKFIKPSRSDEYIIIEILRLILPDVMDKTIIPLLLSPNLLQHILKKFCNCKKNDDVLIAFREVLHLIVSTTNDKDMKTKTQLIILKTLILHPTGDLMIEKKTGTKVIQIITGNLRLDGIKELCLLYKDIIKNKIVKEQRDTKVELYTNAERSYAAQLLTRLMGHPETLSDQKWRLEQLIFLFDHGLCEISNVGIELASQFKDSFYRALDYKLPKLDDVRNLLSALVHDLDSKLQSNAIQLRTPLSDTVSDAWKTVINLIKEMEKNTKIAKALPIFHTMNLHMGLQLFSDPQMAVISINDLRCCYERLIKKSKGDTKINNANVKAEPYWIEVVVDLLLSLLSRNNHLLRSLVGCVFSHVCLYLTPSALHQIISVLDIKNNQNILTTKESNAKDSLEMESESDNDSDDSDDIEENISDNEVSEESESESEYDSENLDDDETMTDKLRMAVHQALGDAATQTDNEDVDVDQIDDEEGERLNKSLAAAFKILRETRQTQSKKQEKTSLAMMHFRLRVIDLLDIYLETCPSMAITLDIIVSLFALLEFCVKDSHQKPLEHRVRACLKKLSAVKRFKDTTGVDNNMLTTILKALIEKGERSASICQELNDKLAECCTFLVRCVQQANLSNESVVEIYIENLTAFFKKRDCVLSSTLFKSILQLCWEGNWQLAPVLVDFAFDSTIRYFRRSQALELLLIFYNNNRLLHMDAKYLDLRMKLETMLYNNTISMLKELCNLQESDNGQFVSYNGNDTQKNVQQKFITLLLTLLRIIHAHHLPQAWNWQDVGAILTMYKNRSTFSKDARNAYNKLAMRIGTSLNASSMIDGELDNKLTVIASHSNNKQNNVITQNGNTDDSKEEISNSTLQKKKKKNKSKRENKQMLKKEARELRARLMSKDLKQFNFSNISLPENQTDVIELLQDENSHDEFISLKSSQKRIHEQSMEESKNEIKRRKSVNHT